MLNIVFFESDNDFSSEEKPIIKNSIEKVVDRAIGLLEIKGIINITIYPFILKILGEPRVMGEAMSREWLSLTIPPKVYSPNDLKGIVYHELHHLARRFTYYIEVGAHRSLINSIFSEGLATAFETEEVPQHTPICAGYDISELEKWFPELKEEMWDSNYNHDAWFFGKGEKPRWLGYKIGMYLVEKISSNHPGLNLNSLVRVDAKKLLELSEGL